MSVKFFVGLFIECNVYYDFLGIKFIQKCKITIKKVFKPQFLFKNNVILMFNNQKLKNKVL